MKSGENHQGCPFYLIKQKQAFWQCFLKKENVNALILRAVLSLHYWM